MMRSASVTASAKVCVSTVVPSSVCPLGVLAGGNLFYLAASGLGRRGLGPAVGGERPARDVVQGEHRLVQPPVAGVRDAPDAVRAAQVAVLVVRRAPQHHAVL